MLFFWTSGGAHLGFFLQGANSGPQSGPYLVEGLLDCLAHGSHDIGHIVGLAADLCKNCLGPHPALLGIDERKLEPDTGDLLAWQSSTPRYVPRHELDDFVH